jgi:SAM-dependent methyltransferase
MQNLGHDRVDLQVASAVDLSFSDAAFDTVVCWEVLKHLLRGSEPQAFSEIARVLAPSGVLYLSTQLADLRSQVTDPAWWLTGHRHYMPRRLRELVGGAGLVVECTVAKGRWWQIAAMMNLYVAKWIFRRRPFIEDRMNRRVDREWSDDDGFTNLYLHARKPGVRPR